MELGSIRIELSWLVIEFGAGCYHYRRISSKLRAAEALHCTARSGPAAVARYQPRSCRHITLSEARSRLYQHQILQPNTHFAAFFEIYKICILLHRFKFKKNLRFRLKIQYSVSQKFSRFLTKNWVWSGAKVCQSCRSRKMLQNEYLLAKFGFDTAENEPLKVWGVIQFNI